MKRKSPKARAKLILPTAAENAAINRAIKADPDTRELTAKDFAQMVPKPWPYAIAFVVLALLFALTAHNWATVKQRLGTFFGVVAARNVKKV